MEDSHFEGISSLVRLSGANVPARARFVGEALVSGMLSALTLGLVCGQVGAAALPCAGPLVPFLVGSWTGYTAGLYRYWQTCQQQARSYAIRYPTLLAHALRTERGILVPSDVVQASILVKQQQQQQEEQEGGGGEEGEENDEEEHTISTHQNTTTTASKTTTTTNDGTSSSTRSSTTLEQWILEGGLGRLSWSILAAQSCRNDVEEIERQERQRLMEEYAAPQE